MCKILSHTEHLFLDSRLSRVQLQPQWLKWPYSVQSVWHHATESSLSSCSVPSPLEVCVCWKDALYDGVLIILPCTSPSLISLKCCFLFSAANWCEHNDRRFCLKCFYYPAAANTKMKHLWQMTSHFNPIYSQHYVFYRLQDATKSKLIVCWCNLFESQVFTGVHSAVLEPVLPVYWPRPVLEVVSGPGVRACSLVDTDTSS